MTLPTTIRLSLFIVAFSFLGTGNGYSQISKSVGLLKGDVSLSDGSPIPNIAITIFKGTEKLTSTKSSPEGKITSILQQDATYRLSVNSSGYMYHEDTLRVPALDAYTEFPLHMVLTPLRDGQAFNLPLPVFAPKARDIDRAATAELDQIANELRHNQKLSVNVTVYPDAPVKTKKDAAQKALAAARETSIRSYFLGKSIAASRFSVESITSSIPPGRFPAPAGAAAEAQPKKKKKGAPAAPVLVPQYVEIVAHVAP